MSTVVPGMAEVYKGSPARGTSIQRLVPIDQAVARFAPGNFDACGHGPDHPDLHDPGAAHLTRPGLLSQTHSACTAARTRSTRCGRCTTTASGTAGRGWSTAGDPPGPSRRSAGPCTHPHRRVAAIVQRAALRDEPGRSPRRAARVRAGAAGAGHPQPTAALPQSGRA